MKYGLVETKKLYFTSAEAAEQVGVPVKVLHSWEKDFPDLKPKKNKAGKRVYNQIDIETAKQIKVVGAVPCGSPYNQNQVAKKTKKDAAKAIGATARDCPYGPGKELLLKIRNDLLKNLLRIHRN